MKTELTLDLVQSQLEKKHRLNVTEESLNEIKKLAENPDYGEEFLDTYLTHIGVLKNHVRANHEQYVNAIKFFILVESDHSIVDSYIKVFPERYEARNRHLPEKDKGKDVVRSEASRFNKSVIVNDIRQLATIPVQLIHRNLLHEAILETAELMRSSRSDIVRQKAAQTLITELKPAEESQININVNDGAGSVIDELRRATERLVTAERSAVITGKSTMKEIAESDIIVVESDGE